MSEVMEVKCPICLIKKTILKTDHNFQVRCSLRDGGCGNKYYTKKNIVLKYETVLGDLWDTIFKSSDGKRFIYLIVEKHTFRGKNKELDRWIKKEFKELGKL